MTADAQSPDAPVRNPTRSVWSGVRRALFVIGVVCCAQFVATALYGVARGYSVHGHWSSEILSFGTLSAALALLGRPKPAMYALFFCAILLSISTSMASLEQGRHQNSGESYYGAGQFQDALNELHKEVDTWYLRLTYNSREPFALDTAAKAYCQLEDFDSARATYELIARLYDGYHRQAAQERLADLEKGLADVARYRQAAANQPDSYEKAQILYDLALTYRFPLSCRNKALETYQRILDLEIPSATKDSIKEDAEKRIRELRHTAPT